jgi:hypothetical protein
MGYDHRPTRVTESKERISRVRYLLRRKEHARSPNTSGSSARLVTHFATRGDKRCTCMPSDQHDLHQVGGETMCITMIK